MAIRPLLMVLTACALVGCGGGQSEKEQIQASLSEFQRATEAKDYQALCDDLLAPDLVETLKQAGLPCEVALKGGLADVDSPRIAIGDVQVDGDKASAEIRSSAEGQEPSDDTIELVKVDGTWRIASLAG